MCGGVRPGRVLWGGRCGLAGSWRWSPVPPGSHDGRGSGAQERQETGCALGLRPLHRSFLVGKDGAYWGTSGVSCGWLLNPSGLGFPLCDMGVLTWPAARAAGGSGGRCARARNELCPSQRLRGGCSHRLRKHGLRGAVSHHLQGLYLSPQLTDGRRCSLGMRLSSLFHAASPGARSDLA